MNTSLKLSKKLSFGEEIANSVTHAVGAVIMLILLPISSTYSYEAHEMCIRDRIKTPPKACSVT